MNLIQRAFNRLWPIEPADSKYRGRAGAAFVHFQDPGLNQCAPAHDKTDDAIRAKTIDDTFESNDERFQRCEDIAEEDDSLYLSNADHRKSRILSAWSGKVIDLYRWLRGED